MGELQDAAQLKMTEISARIRKLEVAIGLDSEDMDFVFQSPHIDEWRNHIRDKYFSIKDEKMRVNLMIIRDEERMLIENYWRCGVSDLRISLQSWKHFVPSWALSTGISVIILSVILAQIWGASGAAVGSTLGLVIGLWWRDKMASRKQSQIEHLTSLIPIEQNRVDEALSRKPLFSAKERYSGKRDPTYDD